MDWSKFFLFSWFVSDNENDRLRAENEQLRQQLAQLEQEEWEDDSMWEDQEDEPYCDEEK
jgi:regulator of replication initiation timing